MKEQKCKKCRCAECFVQRRQVAEGLRLLGSLVIRMREGPVDDDAKLLKDLHRVLMDPAVDY